VDGLIKKMTQIEKIQNLFNLEDIEIIRQCIIDSDQAGEDPNLGRLKIELNNLPPSIENKISMLSVNLFNKNLDFANATYVEYNNKFGQPNLPAHFDHDDKDLVFDYQWEANTSWDLGVGTEVYPLEDNSAIVFNANENIHWRPIKNFKDGEYVKMIFFRMNNKKKPSDYSHLDYVVEDKIFKSVNQFRDRLFNKGHNND
jgi:hypothetical protein